MNREGLWGGTRFGQYIPFQFNKIYTHVSTEFSCVVFGLSLLCVKSIHACILYSGALYHALNDKI
jgi:hypothetical protein